MEADGASQGEQLLDAARRNNVDLLETVFKELEEDPAKIADVVNHSKDPLGNSFLIRTRFSYIFPTRVICLVFDKSVV